MTYYYVDRWSLFWFQTNDNIDNGNIMRLKNNIVPIQPTYNYNNNDKWQLLYYSRTVEKICINHLTQYLYLYYIYIIY